MIVKLDENGGTLQNTFFDKKNPAGNIFSSAMHLLNFSLQYVAGTVLIRFPTVLIFSKISLKGDKNARFLNIFPRLLAVGKSASKDEDASLMHSEPLWPNYGPLKIISWQLVK